MQLALDIDSQDTLSGLRKWNLERDDSGSLRVYRDKEGKPYYSVTTVLQHTASVAKQAALTKWLKKPGSEEARELAASRGTAVHEHCEYIIKTAAKMARNVANKRNGWKVYDDGLYRATKQVTTWALQKAINSAPEPHWAIREYTRNISPFIEDIAAIHASEFSVCHSGGWAGTADALIDYGEKTGKTCIVDFKTTGGSKDKPEEYLTDYLCQLGAYSEALYEQMGFRPFMGVIAIVRPNGLQIREVKTMELIGAGQLFKERMKLFHKKIESGDLTV